jgi:hypothetical protein
VSKNNEARERCQRSQAKSKITEFTDARKIPLRPAPPQPLSDRAAHCSRCLAQVHTLILVVRLWHPSAPAEISRLCARCAPAHEKRTGQARPASRPYLPAANYSALRS